MTRRPPPSRSPGSRVLLSLVPGLLALVIGQWTAGSGASPLGRFAPALAALGASSWLLGVGWYGLAGLGLRGRRPLYAGIGFATLGWLAILLTRLLVPSETISNVGAGSVFAYLLLFESLCVQVWAFGLLFRGVADWRGPLSASLAGGVAFGLVGLLAFRESVWPALAGAVGPLWSVNAFSFFILWGLFYGLVRLRTGSLVGTVLVHALQSFTTWNILLPASPPDPGGYQRFYLFASLILIILVWRLWPRRIEDYRI